MGGLFFRLQMIVNDCPADHEIAEKVSLPLDRDRGKIGVVSMASKGTILVCIFLKK
jgi:hypothetical protein